MEHVLRFKLLTRNLSTDDTKKMMVHLIEHGNVACEMMTAISHYAHQCYQVGDTSFIKGVNDIVSEWKSNQNDVVEPGQPQQEPQQREIIDIQTLPNTMLNNIGSFLQLSDLAKMECVNRTFFVALRHPYPALQSISGLQFDYVDWISRYVACCERDKVPINFQRFRSITSLMTKGQALSDHAPLFGTAFRSVREVSFIDGTTAAQAHNALRSCFDPDIIHTLYLLLVFESDSDASELTQMLRLLKNLKFLVFGLRVEGEPPQNFVPDFVSLMRTDSAEQDAANAEISFLPNLVALETEMPAQVNQGILSSLSSKFKSLTFCNVGNDSFHDSMRLYSTQCAHLMRNLQELKFNCQPQELCQWLVQDEWGWARLPNLKRVFVYFWEWDLRSMQQAVRAIFSNTNLQFIGFEHRPSDLAETSQFYRSLEEYIMEYPRPILTLDLLHRQLGNPQPLMWDVLSLINAMKANIARKFCLIVNARYSPAENLLQVLKESIDIERAGMMIHFKTKGYEPHDWLHGPLLQLY